MRELIIDKLIENLKNGYSVDFVAAYRCHKTIDEAHECNPIIQYLVNFQDFIEEKFVYHPTSDPYLIAFDHYKCAVYVKPYLDELKLRLETLTNKELLEVYTLTFCGDE